MSSLCELRHKTENLIKEFRNFLIRIGQHLMKDAPIIKGNLLEFNKRIQILLSDYHKYRIKLQFLSTTEFESLKSMFDDIESIILADVKAYKGKRCVGLASVRKLDSFQFEVFSLYCSDIIILCNFMYIYSSVKM